MENSGAVPTRSWRGKAIDRMSFRAPTAVAAAVRARELLRHPRYVRFGGLNSIRNLTHHGTSLQPDRSPLDFATPWIVYAALGYVATHIPAELNVGEFGSGGSTLYWLSKGASVVTVEHDYQWAQKVQEKVTSQQQDSLDIRVVEPEPLKTSGPEVNTEYRSNNHMFQHYSFRRYAHALDDLPAESLDLILIDGRARSSSLRAAFDKLRPGGLVVFDNSDRLEYAPALAWAEERGVSWKHFVGPVPCHPSYSQTSVGHYRR